MDKLIIVSSVEKNFLQESICNIFSIEHFLKILFGEHFSENARGKGFDKNNLWRKCLQIIYGKHYLENVLVRTDDTTSIKKDIVFKTSQFEKPIPKNMF